MKFVKTDCVPLVHVQYNLNTHSDEKMPRNDNFFIKIVYLPFMASIVSFS